jgi:hypothetical protein
VQVTLEPAHTLKVRRGFPQTTSSLLFHLENSDGFLLAKINPRVNLQRTTVKPCPVSQAQRFFDR